MAPIATTPFGIGPSWQPSSASLQERQAQLDGFIAVAVWIWAVAGIAGVLNNWANIGYYRALWHWWHAVVHAANARQPLPHQPAMSVGSSVFSLVGLGIVVIDVVFLVWQHRAASTARALRYPARRSPAWGVGCWFVPVVNVWMPYQAIRDCLPPGHPARRRALYAWLLFLSIGVLLVPATLVALVGAPTLGVALVIVSIGAELAFGLNAYRVVTAVAEDHRDRVGAQMDPV